MDKIDPKAAAMVIQDLQNDVIIEGGAFADSGAPAHATAQNVVENVKNLAAACRKAGVPVIHVWYIVEAGASGLRQNAPLFEGVKGANAPVASTEASSRPMMRPSIFRLVDQLSADRLSSKKLLFGHHSS